MKKVLVSAVALWLGAAVLLGQSAPARLPGGASAKAGPQTATPARAPAGSSIRRTSTM
jgi:hypothetical protein